MRSGLYRLRRNSIEIGRKAGVLRVTGGVLGRSKARSGLQELKTLRRKQ
jgi:hypothetical protein